MLAPMASIRNLAFTQEFGNSTSIYVCEMITARAIVSRNEDAQAVADADEHPRSTLGVEPGHPRRGAVRIVAGEGWADHIDLNLGCPVPKVTRLGGGAALPYKRNCSAASSPRWCAPPDRTACR